MSKFIIALIATTFTMTAFADNHLNHTPVNTPMVESTTAVVAPAQAPKHHTKEMHAKKAQHHAKKAQHHAKKAQYHRNVSLQKAVVATPVTN
ncbi:MAG: hypothetical protein RI956_793 [Pseudomonadota bacterium]|jgi:hypothetical protein